MGVLLIYYPTQDPAKPKRKERTTDKVAQTDKAVAKARAELKKIKRSKSIKVNNPSDQGKEPLKQTEEQTLYILPYCK